MKINIVEMILMSGATKGSAKSIATRMSKALDIPIEFGLVDDSHLEDIKEYFESKNGKYNAKIVGHIDKYLENGEGTANMFKPLKTLYTVNPFEALHILEGLTEVLIEKNDIETLSLIERVRLEKYAYIEEVK